MDLLDFYRGTLSARRLAVLVRQLPAEAALVRSLNDGQPPLSITDKFLADMWSLWAKKDHPLRAELAAKARLAEKQAKVIQMKRKAQADKRIGVK